MPYVQRDEAGDIIVLYENPQSFTSEFLPDDDPQIVAFQEKMEAQRAAADHPQKASKK
jgi:hypothetical protein